MKLYQYLKIEDKRDLFIVGDIHGSYDLYKAGEHHLGIRDSDVVISLGDLTDRGNKNFRCVVEFTRKENRYAIRGNHEDLLIRGALYGERDYYHCWQQNGGDTVWDEVGDEGSALLGTMLEDLPVILVVEHRGKRLGFVHGGVPIEFRTTPLTDFQHVNKKDVDRIGSMLMWDRRMVQAAQEGAILPNVTGVDYVFHGHSYVKEPLISGNRIYMDTGGVFNGKLTFATLIDEGIQFHTTSGNREEEGETFVWKF